MSVQQTHMTSTRVQTHTRTSHPGASQLLGTDGKLLGRHTPRHMSSLHPQPHLPPTLPVTRRHRRAASNHRHVQSHNPAFPVSAGLEAAHFDPRNLSTVQSPKAHVRVNRGVTMLTAHVGHVCGTDQGAWTARGCALPGPRKA